MKNRLSAIKNFVTLLVIFLFGLTSVVFSVLYINLFSGLTSTAYSVLITVIITLIACLTALTIICFINNKDTLVYKVLIITTVIISLAIVSLFVLKSTGFLNKFNSVESFREYIASFGTWAIMLFILIQFLQVVVLPIPAFITVGAGVLLYGPLWGSIYSCIGIITGSIVAYFIGRIFGYRVAKWLVGQKSLDKWLTAIKGKDKVVLTFMFLFPFFPDDILCFVAGITTIRPLFFTVMIFLTRIISIFTSSFSMNNSIIPYDTWWGIVLWILIFIITGLITLLILKKGKEIEAFFKKGTKNNR